MRGNRGETGHQWIFVEKKKNFMRDDSDDSDLDNGRFSDVYVFVCPFCGEKKEVDV